MFKLLNLFRPTETEIETESMRARFERVTAELNDVLSQLDELPELTVDATNRRIDVTTPEQFADEALALPKPSDAELDTKAETESHVETDEVNEKSSGNKEVGADDPERSAA